MNGSLKGEKFEIHLDERKDIAFSESRQII